MTPLKAIRARCVDCMETAGLIRKCPHGPDAPEPCALWPFRFGRKPEGRRLGRQSTRKAIQRYCRDHCMAGLRGEVKRCPSQDCPLFAFRLGPRARPEERRDVAREAPLAPEIGHMCTLSDANGLGGTPSPRKARHGNNRTIATVAEMGKD